MLKNFDVLATIHCEVGELRVRQKNACCYPGCVQDGISANCVCIAGSEWEGSFIAILYRLKGQRLHRYASSYFKIRFLLSNLKCTVTLVTYSIVGQLVSQ
jgi:hypothetical protein